MTIGQRLASFSPAKFHARVVTRGKTRPNLTKSQGLGGHRTRRRTFDFLDPIVDPVVLPPVSVVVLERPLTEPPPAPGLAAELELSMPRLGIRRPIEIHRIDR